MARTGFLVCFGLFFALTQAGRADSPTGPGDAAGQPADPQVLRQSVLEDLQARFDGYCEQPGAYRDRALDECRGFPEGKIYPFLLPTYGYINLATSEPDRREQHLANAAAQLDLVLPIVAERLDAPGGDLSQLEDDKHQGAYLAYLAFALSGYRVAGGDDRYDPIRRTICDVMADAIQQRDGRPLRSYPITLWSLDTTAAIAALHLDDQHTGQGRYTDVVAQHLDWLKDEGSDPILGLPYTRHNVEGTEPIDKPRGCDLAWRVAILRNVDPPYAADLYDRFVRTHWLERPPLSGFAEWPFGQKGFAGVDSGPILRGIGATASSFGVAATRAAGDAQREQRLLEQLASLRMLAQLTMEVDPQSGKQMVGGIVEFDPSYTSGFLYGDCVLFYVLTYRPWGEHGHGSDPGAKPE